MSPAFTGWILNIEANAKIRMAANKSFRFIIFSFPFFA